MKIAAISLALALLLGQAAARAAESTGTTLDIWPGPAPGEVGAIGEETSKKAPTLDRQSMFLSIRNVSKPTLTVWRAEPAGSTGAAVLIFPGGGYSFLAWDNEGEEAAHWLNSIGVTAAVLKYRVPRREGTAPTAPPIQALMDAQRAMSLLRHGAADWGIDPQRIGVLGFSAGGHLAAWTATSFDKRSYEPVDAMDVTSCRPDFAIMIYPGFLVKHGTTELSPEIRVTPQTPPCFFTQACDDHVGAENSVGMYLALRKAGVPADLHIYASGGHGYGLRTNGKPVVTWPKRCEEWLRDIGMIR